MPTLGIIRLMYFGKEAKNTNRQQVYAMPAMKKFLETNGPWSQFVADSNIVLQEVPLSQKPTNETFSITPVPVPHRDEFSETVGYFIFGPTKKRYLFLVLTNGQNGTRILLK